MARSEHLDRCDLYVFGANDEGQLGNGRRKEKEFIPSVAIEGSSFRSMVVVGGSKHTLLLNELGDLFVTGRNAERQLGSAVPEKDGASQFVKKDTRALFCAATWDSSLYTVDSTDSQERLYTEGRGNHGELGRGQITSLDSLMGAVEPLAPALPNPIRWVAAGHSHYIAVLQNGQVWGWGRNNKGQLGSSINSKTLDRPTHLQDIPFEAHNVTCGKEFTYIVGHPSKGAHTILGPDKGGIKSEMPLNVKDWKQIGATWGAIFVLFQDGTLKAWGQELLYQLVPPNLPLIDRIAVGSEHILALTREGKSISWGWGEHGNCGDVSKMDPPPVMPRCCVSGRWNEIDIPGRILALGAAQATSFVLTEVSGPT